MTNAVGTRAVFGVIVPSTNTVVEHDYWRAGLDGVSYRAGSMYIPNPVMGDDEDFTALLGQIRGSIDTAVRDVLTAEPDRMVMGMSAETFWGGVAGNESFNAGCANAPRSTVLTPTPSSRSAPICPSSRRPTGSRPNSASRSSPSMPRRCGTPCASTASTTGSPKGRGRCCGNTEFRAAGGSRRPGRVAVEPGHRRRRGDARTGCRAVHRPMDRRGQEAILNRYGRIRSPDRCRIRPPRYFFTFGLNLFV